MTFELSKEHQDFRAVMAEFAAAEVRPYAADWDREHRFPTGTVRRLGELGVFGLHAPEEYGGAGDFTSLCLAIEELGRADQSLGITVEAGVGLGINPIASFGSDDQKQRWLPELITGR
ncbi:MAG TPA: acyl-CoA dehydrogenase family protein, partial [Microlunatus sp.]